MPYQDEKNSERNAYYSSSSRLEFSPIAFVPIAYDFLSKSEHLLNDNDDLPSKAKALESYSSPNDRKEARNAISKMDSGEIYIRLYDYLERGYSPRKERTDSKVASLVYKLLNLKDGDSILDLGCGDGSFLASIYNQTKKDNVKLSNIYGIETRKIQSYYASLSLCMLCDNGVHVDIVTGDALKENKFTYNKGYVYPPVGQRQQLLKTENISSILYPDIELKGSLNEQWIYVDRLLANLEGEDARAVALLFSKSLINIPDNWYYHKLLEDGWIEEIDTLPSSAMPYLATKKYLVVFSRGNKEVKYDTAFDDENSNDETINFLHSYNQRDDLYSMNIDAYVRDVTHLRQLLDEQQQTFSGPLLSSVADIDVGSQYTTSSFTLSNEDTGYKILTASDIDNGMVRWGELRSIEKNKSFRDSTFAHKNDVIISSKSTKVKIAVVTKEPEDRVIVTGGMIIIRPNTKKLNPLYLKLYLESDEGQAALGSIQTGSVIMHISPRLVENLQIPLPSIETQDEKVKEYTEISSQIEALQEQIDELNQKIKEIKFSEEEDEEHAKKE